VSFCNLTETKLELDMSCLAEGCRATRIRTSPGLPLSSTLFQNQTAAKMFLASMQLTMGTPSTADPNDAALADRFARGESSTFFKLWIRLDKYGPTVPGSSFQEKFDTDIVNDQTSSTLIKMVNSYLSVSQDVTRDLSSVHLIDVLRGAVKDPGFTVATFKAAQYFPQYRINWVWMILDFVSCVVLMVAAAVAVWLRTRTLAPDIFGYVSSLTRDNPLVQLPQAGSTLNGIDRARLLKDVKVKIADVGAENDVGRVGLVVKNDSQENVTELKKGKRYV
jgi:hypothetical protein